MSEALAIAPFASAKVTCTNVLVSGFIAVSHNSPAFISPRPLNLLMSYFLLLFSFLKASKASSSLRYVIPEDAFTL